MSNIHEFPELPKPTYGTEFHGPFVEYWKVTSHGYKVPNLTAQIREDDGVTTRFVRWGVM